MGKILQPINYYTRFPEYDFIGNRIESHLQKVSTDGISRILDVGSPKCFGLYLAFHYKLEVHLTDIDRASIDEAKVLWSAIEKRAKGSAVFSVQDARLLNYPDQTFDIVYSMSVIEHIEGSTADSEAMRELSRTLKPGGLLAATMPIGEKYVEQERIGLQGSARVTKDERPYFFQRIYTPMAVAERIISAVPDTTLSYAVTACRRRGTASNICQQLGENARGAIGFLSPLLSAALNYTRQGIVAAQGQYGAVNSPADIYGDAMLAWEKH
ncbi:MAG: class I SAM-dependent methyltransferase [Terriglobia bacterium]